MPDPDLLAELDAAAIGMGESCWCGRPADVCTGSCPAAAEITRLRDALARHQQWCTYKGQRLCGGCLDPWPCGDHGLACLSGHRCPDHGSDDA